MNSMLCSVLLNSMLCLNFLVSLDLLESSALVLIMSSGLVFDSGLETSALVLVMNSGSLLFQD